MEAAVKYILQNLRIVQCPVWFPSCVDITVDMTFSPRF